MKPLWTIKVNALRLAKNALLSIFCTSLCSVFAQTAPCFPVKKQLFENGRLTYEVINTYNKSGWLLESKTQLSRSEVESYRTSKVMAYDNRGNATEITEFLEGRFLKKTIRAYDALNKVTAEAVLLEEGKVALPTLTVNGLEKVFRDMGSSGGRTVKVFNVAGNVMKESVFADNGDVSLTIQNTYNEANKLTKIVRTEVPQNQVTETVFSYNASGNLTEEVKTINGEAFERFVNEFEGGNLTKKTAYNRYGTKDYELTYTYNSLGNVASESYFYNNELISKKENTYDAKQNLIRQNIFERGKLVSFVTWEYTCL